MSDELLAVVGQIRLLAAVGQGELLVVVGHGSKTEDVSAIVVAGGKI